MWGVVGVEGIADGIHGGDCGNGRVVCMGEWSCGIVGGVHCGGWLWRIGTCDALVLGSGVFGVVGEHVCDMSEGNGAASAHSVEVVGVVVAYDWFVFGAVVVVSSSIGGGVESSGMVESWVEVGGGVVLSGRVDSWPSLGIGGGVASIGMVESCASLESSGGVASIGMVESCPSLKISGGVASIGMVES